VILGRFIMRLAAKCDGWNPAAAKASLSEGLNRSAESAAPPEGTGSAPRSEVAKTGQSRFETILVKG